MKRPRPSSPEAQPCVSVIVPTYSRPAALRQCLAALAAQDYPQERFEVIVVDDGSDPPVDGTVSENHDALQLSLLRQSNAGPGAARNRGAAAASGSLLAFTDDDCRPEPDWLCAFVRRHTQAPADLLGGRVLNYDPDNIYAEASQLILDGAYRFYAAHPGPGRFFASNNLAVPAAEFAALGGFDEGFRVASEDRDLCDRWLHAGRRLRFVADAVVRHAPQLDLGQFARQYFNYGRGAFQYHRARRSREPGHSATALGLHARFLAEVGKGLAQRGTAGRVRIAALLLLWQGANLAGFVAGALKRPAL